MTDITPDNFLDIAEANGIARKTAWNRFHYLGWGAVEAATLKANQLRSTPKRKAIKVAAFNGISRNCFEQRVRHGWTLKRASTEPVGQYFRD